MTHIVASAQTTEWTTREADPDDQWDNGDTAGRVDNVVAHIESDPMPYYGSSESRELPVAVGDTVWAVVVDYESGCTFGRSGGHADVLDVFATAREAQALAEAALASDKDDGYGFTHNGNDYSKAWKGYFESLNSIDVWECVVKAHPADPFTDDPQPGYKRGS